MKQALKHFLAAACPALAGLAIAQPAVPDAAAASPADAESAPGATPRTVFAPAAVPANAKALKHTRSFIGIRPDATALLATNPGDTLVLRVAEGVDILMAVDSVQERTATRRSLVGRVPGAQQSSVILVLEDDALAGDIRLPTTGQHFRMRYVADGVHLVCEVDDRAFADCGGSSPAPVIPGRIEDHTPDPVLPPPPPGYTPRGACSNIETTFDVMVVYSDIARAAAGGTTAIRAEIQLGVDTANLTYDNSFVAAHYRLVWQGEVVYDENGPMTAHRDRLYNDADGYYDWVPGTKDTYNADMCSIWVDDDDGDQWCGYALCGFTGAEAYCSVNWECAVGSLSYPHEHGHNQDSDHNPEDAGSCTQYNYSFGHRFAAGGDFHRTVMAYNTSGGPYARIPYWSNPDVNYLGVATGTATRDNARSLNNVRGTVEGWETTRYDIWIDQDPAAPAFQAGTYVFPYDTAAEGFAAIQVPHSSVSTLPVLHVVTGQYNYTGTVSKEMLITPCGGSATIGTP